MSGPNNRPWGLGSNSTEDWRRRIEVLRQFNIQNGSAGQGIRQIVSVRHGLLAVVAGLSFVLLQIKHQPRFSVRTMLVATTLVAVVLGLGAWLAS